MFFQISPNRIKPKSPIKTNESETIETLYLAPFTPLPKLFFENIKVGETAIRKLLVKNTTNQEVTLFVNTTIPKELNVTYNWEIITLDKNSEEIFELSWCPLREESARHCITFENFKKIRRDVPVAFKSVNPSIKAKNGSKAISAKNSHKQKVPPKKSPTKKYYSSKPSNISPKRFSSGSSRRVSPLKNRNLQSSKIDASPIKTCSYKAGDKENVPKELPLLMLNELADSNVFVSPKNSTFLLENMRSSPRRETYVLATKMNNIPKSTPTRETIILETQINSLSDFSRGRETMVLKTKNNYLEDFQDRRKTIVLSAKASSPSDQFNDSLEDTSPKLPPIETETLTKSAHSYRQPLNFNRDNIPTASGDNQNFSSYSFEYKLRQMESFCFSPITTPFKQSNCFTPPECSTTDKTKTKGASDLPPVSSFQLFPPHDTNEIDASHLNISSDTYVECNVTSETYIKENISCETYVQANVSAATYTKDTSVGNIDNLSISPLSSQLLGVSPPIRRCSLGLNQIKSPTDIWNGLERRQLSCIQEESYIHNTTKESMAKSMRNTSLKRKSEIDFTFLPPKRPNIPRSPKNWSKRGGSATRVAKRTSGLNLKQFVDSNNSEGSREINARISKTDTSRIIVQNPFLLAATNLVDPFMTPGLYVDQEWIDQQEIHFKKWLNALLTPPEDLASEEQVIDVSKVWQECKKRETVEEAPSRETVCNKYHTNNTRLNTVRKAAQDLFRSSQMNIILSKVHLAVDQGKLSIREDKDVHLNVSIKSEIISLLLSYNPLWLRIGLETVYNEVIALNSYSDIVGLSSFIVNRLLKDPYLIRKYRSVHAQKYAHEFNKFFLKKFLTIVYFLDHAKTAKLISHDPCLFNKKAMVKESRDLLLRLARETLSSVGDITKLLKYCGYVVTHVQTYIHEFDYAVRKLGVDLRDGVRLTKVMEIILLKNNLTANLRVPAISRLQKIHNVKIVFQSLEEAGCKILYDISPKDIVDGHREKTLSFLWQIIYKFEAPLMVKSATTIQTWFKSLPIVLKRRHLNRNRTRKENAAVKIQKWYRRYKLLAKLKQFTEMLIKYLEIRKMEAAATEIQAYYRMYCCRREYVNLKEFVTKIQARCRGWLARKVDRQLIGNAIIIQSHFRRFVVRKRFLTLKRATLTIQQKYKAKKLMQKTLENYIRLKSAAIVLQRRYRAKKVALIEQQAYQKLRTVTMTIQQRFRANRFCKIERMEFLKLKSATLQIQTWYRMTRCKRKYKSLKKNVTIIEERYILIKAMRLERKNYLTLKSAAITIQQQYRATKQMKIERNRYLQLLSAAVVLQRRYRAQKLMETHSRYYNRLKRATVLTQRRFRALVAMRVKREKFIKIKTAVVKIQDWFRATQEMKVCRAYYISLKLAVKIVEERYGAKKLMIKDREVYQSKKSAVLILQRRYRAAVAMKVSQRRYVALQSVTICIQSKFRANRLAKQQRKEYLSLQQATVLVQNRFRANKLMREAHTRFVCLKRATLTIQRRYRSNILMRHARTSYETTKNAALTIQRRFRAQRAMLEQVQRYNKLKKAAVTVQQHWRARTIGTQQQKQYQALRRAVVLTQVKWRATKLAKQEKYEYESLKKAAINVQRRWRAKKLCQSIHNEFKTLKKVTITIQQLWRTRQMGRIQRKHYEDLKKAVLFTQSRWHANRRALEERSRYKHLRNAAIVLETRWRAKKLGEKTRTDFVSLKKATITIQQRWRAKKIGSEQRKLYEDLRRAVIFIQSRWCAVKLTSIEKSKYRSLKIATTVLQRRWRAKKLCESARSDFIRLKNAAVTIQQKWRAKKISEEQRRYYEQLKKAVIFTQARWRANRLAKREKSDYESLRKATIVLQRKWTAKKMCKQTREDFQILRAATVLIQQRWRAKKIGREQRKQYELLRQTAIFIQSKWRAVRQQSEYKLLRRTTITVQRRWRARQLCIETRNNFVMLKRTTVTLQAFVRGYLIRSKYAYYFSVEARERRKIEKIQRNAVMKILAVWRGYKCRIKENPNLEKIRRNLMKANENAVPELTLESRSRVALQAFTNEHSLLFNIIKALEVLDYTIKHSTTICETMSKLLPPQLYIMLSATSRSLPEMNACIFSVNILITFYKFPSTRRYSFMSEHIDDLITLMLNWCDKESLLFPTACTLLWLFAHIPEWKQFILKLPNFNQRFEKIQTLVLRKENMVKRTGVKGSSVFFPYKELPLPSLKPDWGLVYVKPTFNNSVHAFWALSSILDM